MRYVLLDTGPIVALLDRSDGHHARCVEAISEIDATLVTCEPVIAEACYLLRNVRGAPEAVLQNVERGVFQLPFRLAPESGAVSTLVSKYRRVPMDLADACLVRLAELVGTARVLTLDRDFDIYRWRKTRKFERLISLDD
ncbi:MAG: PIN domain-containing protein [Myxococcota bacterium]|nr:PIN domain-containing protein [Myxococcota bacterium]